MGFGDFIRIISGKAFADKVNSLSPDIMDAVAKGGEKAVEKIGDSADKLADEAEKAPDRILDSLDKKIDKKFGFDSDDDDDEEDEEEEEDDEE